MSRLIGGRYELIQPAGEGGMASVWRGRTIGAAGFERPVAIKRILPALARDPEFVAMFVEEARVVSELQHPNIVQIHDFGIESGEYFCVMEWVEGMDLGRWTRAFVYGGGKTSWQLVLAIAIEALRGLAAAHERTDPTGRSAPIYHRDVSPHNVLLGTNGVVKLSDFGLARATDRASMTRPQIVKGKIAYMAPEVTYGLGPSVGTDIFGLGVVVWEALAGKRLFEGETTVEVINSVRKCDVAPLQQLRPDLPTQLVAVLFRALSASAEHRFPSAHEMGRAFARILRQTNEPTDAKVLGQSVKDARQKLVHVPADALSGPIPTEIDVAPKEPSSQTEVAAVPLTRVRPSIKP